MYKLLMYAGGKIPPPPLAHHRPGAVHSTRNELATQESLYPPSCNRLDQKNFDVNPPSPTAYAGPYECCATALLGLRDQLKTALWKPYLSVESARRGSSLFHR